MMTKEYIHSLGIESVVNYLRKSRQDEELERRTGEDTLKAQTDMMERVLRPLSVHFVQKAEIGSGDKISTRPVFQSIISDLGIGKYQAIAVKEISRMGRGSYTDMGIIYDLIVEKRIFVITPWKIYDPKNNADLRQIRFELFMSREEFETTRERLSGGRYNSALAGRWVSGKPPYGYNLDPKTRKLVINKEEAAVIRMLFDIYVNGLDVGGTIRDVRSRAIATHFTRIGIPTPKGGRMWRAENLQYMLENDVYIGTMRYRTTKTINGKAIARDEDEHVIVEDAHEPIIDLETWSRAQEKNKSKVPVSRTKLDAQKYELTGLVRCSCGGAMIRQAGERRRVSKLTGEERVYKKEMLWCRNNSCGSVSYQGVLADLVAYLSYLADLDDSMLKAILEQSVKQDNSQENHEQTMKYIERRKNELQKKLQFIYDQYEEQFYDRQKFIERKSEVETELKRLEAMAIPPTEGEKLTDVMLPIVKKNIRDLTIAYKSANREQKNKLLHSFFYEIIVKKTSKGVGRIKPTYDILPLLRYDITRKDFLTS